RRHTRSDRDWSSDVCSSDLQVRQMACDADCASRELFDTLRLVDAGDGDGNLRAKRALNSGEDLFEKPDDRIAVWCGFFVYCTYRSEERRVGKECRVGRAGRR